MGKISIEGTGQRFRAVARELFDGNKSELARSLGMQPSSFAKYTDGRRQPGTGILAKLARLGVNINWFLSGEGSMLTDGPSISDSETVVLDGVSASSEAPDYHPIPIVRLRTDENGKASFERTAKVHWVSESFLAQEYNADPEDLQELRISGLSLGEIIRPGDRVLIERGDCKSLSDGSLCLVSGPLGLFIRRIRLRGDTVVLGEDRSDAPEQALSREQWNEKYRPLARILEVRHPL